MKTSLMYSLAFWVMCLTAIAQNKKPDVIIKTDNSRIECVIIEIEDDFVKYKRPNETNIQRINRSMVAMVTYASGETETFNALNKSSTEKAIDGIIGDMEKNKSVKDRKIRFQNILFETNSSKIQPQSFALLDSIAQFLVKIPTIKLEVGGHGDNKGKEATNQRLSQERADAVLKYLVVEKKILRSRITAAGYGFNFPVANNNTEQGRAMNRRVELKFLELSQDVYTIVTKDGRRISATYWVLSADNKDVSYKENESLKRLTAANIDYIVYPDGTRRRIGSTEIIGKNEDSKQTGSKSKVPVKNLDKKEVDIQINGLLPFMLSNKIWTNLTEGYAHTIGFGGSLMLDYPVFKGVSLGAEVGHFQWNTQVDFLAAPGEAPFYSYRTTAAQTFLLAHIRINLNKHFYLMPEGGFDYSKIKADDNDFSRLQTTYGATLGYVFNPNSKVRLDASLLYRYGNGSKTWDIQYGVASMNYIGLRLGLGFNLRKREKFITVTSPLKPTYTPPPPTTTEAKRLKVFFDLSKSDILPESYKDLNEVSAWLLRNTKIEIRLEGHTDKIGDANDNLILSNDRVKAVKMYFVRKGIDADRITVVGYGDTRLVCRPSPCDDNRRVEMRITKQ